MNYTFKPKRNNSVLLFLISYNTSLTLVFISFTSGYNVDSRVVSNKLLIRSYNNIL